MIKKALKRNTTLTELILCGDEKNWNKWEADYSKWIREDNKIGDEGTRMISEALKNNSTLTTLYLSSD